MTALNGYLAAARVVDPKGMAAAFTPTGVLFEPGIQPIESRDSIQAFLASFPGATVESVTAVPDTIEVYGSSAYLWGHYFERLTFPGQPRSEQHGRFVIHWLRQPDGKWLIHRYYRVPLPAAPERLAFAITFPRPGDTLVEGRTYVIRWMAPDTFQINLGAAIGGKDKGMLLNDVPARSDSLAWIVPVGFVTGFGPASSDQVRLRLENARNPDQWTEAGPFTIRGKLGIR